MQGLERLREGNARFVSDRQGNCAQVDDTTRGEFVGGQAPFAAVLGCADSRVPAEIVFDEGLGQLFVVRVAGNIVAPSLVGSIEFAAEAFGTRLVIVMGHSNCGAVRATIDQLRQPSDVRSPNLRSIVQSISPSVQPLVENDAGDDESTLVEQAVRANVRASADQLRNGSAVLKDLIRDDGLVVIGAAYSLETGKVDFFDGVPDQSTNSG